MPAIIAAVAAIISSLIPVAILFWFSSNPKALGNLGDALGNALGKAGSGAGEGVITPLLIYTGVGGFLAIILAVASKKTGRLVGEDLGPTAPPPGFAPAPTFGGSIGISSGPFSAGLSSSTAAPVFPSGGRSAPSRRRR